MWTTFTLDDVAASPSRVHPGPTSTRARRVRARPLHDAELQCGDSSPFPSPLAWSCRAPATATATATYQYSGPYPGKDNWYFIG